MDSVINGTEINMKVVKQFKVNVTYGLDLSPDETFFTIVTRHRPNTSSIFDYELQLFDLREMKRKKKVYIYSTYKQNKHYCKILSDLKTIVVATFQHVIFYDQNLNLKHKELHYQLDISDIEASPDSKLVAFVGGQTVAIWDSATFKRVDIQPFDKTTKSCRFSKDNQYMGILTIQKLKIYKVVPFGYTFQFTQFKTINTYQDFKGRGAITTFDFNPLNNKQLAIGFDSNSPKLYNLQTKQLKEIAHEEQPNLQNNYKYVQFMPDGKRILSSDKSGFGLWPGVSNRRLTYVQGLLLHSLQPYSNGQKILGYNWETIYQLEIQYQCKKQSAAASCPCEANYFWDHRIAQCNSCIQGSKNICLCGSNQRFVTGLGRCVYNCQSVSNAIKSLVSYSDQVTPCFCELGYLWKNGQCVLDCSKNFSTVGPNAQGSKCICRQNFIWNPSKMQCVCGQNLQLIKDKNNQYVCECFYGYQFNEKYGKCMPVCSKDINSLNSYDQLGNCQCKQGYMFEVYQNISLVHSTNRNNTLKIYSEATSGACVRNCSMINETLGRLDLDVCVCKERTKWVGDSCSLDCASITHASINSEKPNECRCSLHYHWVPQINQCGKDCHELSFTNPKKYSNTESCPCIDKFQWDETNKICRINCLKVNDSEPYSTTSTSSCICRQVFNWDPKSLSCEVDCQQIWDADKRINSGQCSCKNGKIFNKEKNICQNASVQGVFSRPWIWAVLGLSILFVIIVAVVMIKFCWKFSTKDNKEHNKKLKMNTEPKIKKKKQAKNGQTITVSSERAQLTKG